MKCSKCGNQDIKPGQKFCMKCGHSLMPVNQQQSNNFSPNRETKCSKCGNQDIKPGQKFCMKCGQPLVNVQNVSQENNKGVFSRVGAGIASAATGGSFSQGYAQQREREHNYDALNKAAIFEIQRAQSVVKELFKNFPNAVSVTDQMEVESIISAIQQALGERNAEYGVRNGKVTGLLKKLQEKVLEMKVKADPQFAQQQASPVTNEVPLNNRTVPVVSLSDVNADELAVVRNKAIWGIQPGQIARRITERELDSVTGLNGFIIQEGCQAMIFVNGNLVTVMDAGSYNVPQRNEQMMKQEFDKLYAEMEQQDREKRATQAANQKPQSIAERGGLVGIAGGFLRRGWEFVFGASPAKKEKESNENAERMRRLKAEVEKALKVKNPEPVMSLIIVSKRHIPLSFGGTPTDGGVEYKPYTIPVGIFDVKMGVMLQLKVTNICEFATNYLTDRNSVTTNDFFNILTNTVENCLRQNLRNVNYQQEGLAPAMVENLKQQVQGTINRQLFGIECVQVVQITDQNSDFERFRQVERELYCSEKELDFLQRTGEFRNRLEQEKNTQMINSARNKEDFAYAMQQVNKDHLLHEDEMAEFVMLLESQRRVREAKNKEEEYEALQDLRKNRLVKDDEVAALEDALAQNKIRRDSITEIMRIQNLLKVDNERLHAEWALDDQKQDHDWEREDLQRRRNWGVEDEQREREWMHEEQEYNRNFTRRQQLDEYDWQKKIREEDYDWQKEERQRETDWNQRLREEQLRRENEQVAYERSRQDKFDDIDILERKGNIAMRNMQVMKEQELQQLREQNRSTESLHSMDVQAQMNRDNMEVQMSAEQIWARNAQHLDAAAQAEWAKSHGSAKENELLQKQQAEQAALYQQMLQMQQSQGAQNQQMMMQMAQMMQQGMMGTAGANMATQQAMFQQQQQFQQQRYDDQMQRANEYKQDAYRQQDRMDAQNQVAMGSMAQINTAAAGNLYTNSTNINMQPQQHFQQQDYQQPAQGLQQMQTGIKRCPQCGIELDEDAMFCGECGFRF